MRRCQNGEYMGCLSLSRPHPSRLWSFVASYVRVVLHAVAEQLMSRPLMVHPRTSHQGITPAAQSCLSSLHIVEETGDEVSRSPVMALWRPLFSCSHHVTISLLSLSLVPFRVSLFASRFSCFILASDSSHELFPCHPLKSVPAPCLDSRGDPCVQEQNM